MDGLAISWLIRGLVFAFLAGAWSYGLRFSRTHWLRWFGTACSIYLCAIPIWQTIERPRASLIPGDPFSPALLTAIGAGWGVMAGFMLITLIAIRDSALDTGTRHKLRAVLNGEDDEGTNAA